MTELVNHEAVCRTAQATPGLLILIKIFMPKKPFKKITTLKIYVFELLNITKKIPL